MTNIVQQNNERKNAILDTVSTDGFKIIVKEIYTQDLQTELNMLQDINNTRDFDCIIKGRIQGINIVLTRLEQYKNLK